VLEPERVVERLEHRRQQLVERARRAHALRDQLDAADLGTRPRIARLARIRRIDTGPLEVAVAQLDRLDLVHVRRLELEHARHAGV
jgi:hypothetical protein